MTTRGLNVETRVVAGNALLDSTGATDAEFFAPSHRSVTDDRIADENVLIRTSLIDAEGVGA